jgi:hypothetical protein
MAEKSPAIKNAAPEVVDAVEQGKLSRSTAAELAKHDHDRQRVLLKACIGQPAGIARAVARTRKEVQSCSHSLRLSGADVFALQALAAAGRASSDARVRAGVLVLVRIAPCARNENKR